MTYKPEVRREGLTMQEVGDDLVVYDARSRQAHRLNKTAAVVLQYSDGTRTVEEIALLLSGETELAEKQATVLLAVDDFAKAGLLAEAYKPPEDLVQTRRNLLKKAAVMAFALPIVESIFAPTPAHAVSGGGGGGGSPPPPIFTLWSPPPPIFNNYTPPPPPPIFTLWSPPPPPGTPPPPPGTLFQYPFGTPKK